MGNRSRSNSLLTTGLAALSLALATGCGSPQGPTTTAGATSPGPSTTAPSGPARPTANSAHPTENTAQSDSGQFRQSAAGRDVCGEDPCVSLTVTGDFLLHPGLWQQARQDAARTHKGTGSAGAGDAGLDFAPLIAAQKPYLAQADLSICHVETPVATPEGPYSGYPSFNVPPQILAAAKSAGYDACTNASNHTIDQGLEGVKRTSAALDKAGLPHTGANLTEAQSRTPSVFTASNGARVSVITGTYGLNGQIPDVPWRVDSLDPAMMIAKAKAARAAGADIVVANIHAGDEYASVPNDQQRTVAHSLVDSGQFDFVYGEHTHSVLPIEKYKGTWIVYGLGNNLTELSPVYQVNNEGLIVNAVFTRKDGKWAVSRLRWAPSLIVDAPYRWCPVARRNPLPSCAPADQAAASRARTAKVVNSMGADKAGAEEWDLPR